MEIQEIVIPEIKVFTYIPATNESLNIPLPNVGMPGCVKTHRDISIKNTQIAEELALPPVKIHCSVLAEDAIKAAVADYRKKHE